MHVAIIGLGPSAGAFFDLAKRLGGASAYCDQVWGINAMGDVLRCDIVFHMDDMRVQEARAEANPTGNIAAMVKWLQTYPGRVMTSVSRYPTHEAFPLADILNASHESGAVPYFNSTAAYAVAYAIHVGATQISLFGIDYTLPNRHEAEQGRACVEYWLGVAAAKGIVITVPDQSSLLDACQTDRDRLYGYDCVDVTFREGSGPMEVIMTDRPEPVDAAEIERRYDHNKHPNPLMQGT